MYEGRLFTRYDLLRAIVNASGNKAQGLSLVWEDLPIYTIIELIEVVRENREPEDLEEW